MDKLEVINLEKEYEGKPLLRGINFEVATGETLCLLGRSGSGKSTILRIIAGIERAGSGRVLWNGTDVSDVPVHKRNFSLMFQDYALFPHLDVTANVAFGLRMRKIRNEEISSRVKEALEQVNMLGFENRRVTDLSGGEQQRIALARALAPRPALLMLDEPLAALDHTLRVELQEDLRSLLKKTGIPTIYVTHDQEEAIVLGDRLALLHDGRIIQSDLTETVFQHPANRWAAEFLGLTNFLDAEVSSVDPMIVHTSCGDFSPEMKNPDHPPRIGEKLTLLLKPTGVEFGPTGDIINTLIGTVVESSFRGDHFRLRLQVCNGQTFQFVSPLAFEIGDQVTIRFSSTDLVCLE